MKKSEIFVIFWIDFGDISRKTEGYRQGSDNGFWIL